MAIYERLMGVVGLGGRVVLACKECKALAQDAQSAKLLKVCSSSGMPLGEWDTVEQRDAELKDFAEDVKLHNRAGAKK